MDASIAKKVVTLPDNVLKIKIKKEKQDNTTTETDNRTEIIEIEMTGMKNKDTTDKIGIEKILMTGDIVTIGRTDTEDKGGVGKAHIAILLSTNEDREILLQDRDLVQEIVIITTEVIHHDATDTMMSEEEIVVILGTNTIEGAEVTLHALHLRDDKCYGNVFGWSWFDLLNGVGWFDGIFVLYIGVGVGLVFTSSSLYS
jgi:hypothetical protein